MKYLLILLSIMFCFSAFSKDHKFEFSAGYNWGETIDVSSPTVFGRSGLITGSWQWRFANGRKGNTHFRSATVFRSNPYALVGTIELNMWELEGTEPG